MEGDTCFFHFFFGLCVLFFFFCPVSTGEEAGECYFHFLHLNYVSTWGWGRSCDYFRDSVVVKTVPRCNLNGFDNSAKVLVSMLLD